MSVRAAPPPGWEGILFPGEEILWQGRPDGVFKLSGMGLFQAIFGIAFAGFALLWMVLAASGPGGFWMFGLIHFSVGLGLSFHGTFWPTFLRRHTWYTLTDQRAFIATNLPIRGRKLDAYPIDAETDLRMQYSDIPSVWFAHRLVKRQKRRGYNKVDIGFEQIHDAREVMDMMMEIQRKAKGAGNARTE